MTETTWSEEVAQPPKKKGIPVWVWGCGGGCLLALIAALVGGVFLAGRIKEGLDPEVVWPKIAQVLPFDQRPGYTVIGWNLGLEAYVMIDEAKGMTGVLFPATGEDPAEMDKLFKGEAEGGAFGIGEIKEAEILTIDVDGRPCRALRFVSSQVSVPGVPKNANTAIMLLDLSRDPSRVVLLELIDQDGEVDQADVTAFLEPFDPWR